MNDPLIDSKTLDWIQKKLHLNSLSFMGSEQFGSTTANYRSLLRQEIIHRWGLDLSPTDIESISDLSQVPVLEKYFLSISHCPHYGGAFISNAPIGFDIESIGRLQKNLTARVSTESEVLMAPEHTYLWSCKEAAFKVLQPTISGISEISIHQWESHSETGLWAYRVQLKKALEFSHNLGFIFKKNNLLVSIYFK